MQKATREVVQKDRPAATDRDVRRALYASEGLSSQIGLLVQMWKEETLQPETIERVTDRFQQYAQILDERTLPLIAKRNQAIIDAVDLELAVLET